MRIAIIDTSTTRAAIISDGLREAGLDDIVVIDGTLPPSASCAAGCRRSRSSWRRSATMTPRCC